MGTKKSLVLQDPFPDSAPWRLLEPVLLKIGELGLYKNQATLGLLQVITFLLFEQFLQRLFLLVSFCVQDVLLS